MIDKPHRGAPPGNRHHFKGGRAGEFHARINVSLHELLIVYLRQLGITQADWLEQQIRIALGKEQPK